MSEPLLCPKCLGEPRIFMYALETEFIVTCRQCSYQVERCPSLNGAIQRWNTKNRGR